MRVNNINGTSENKCSCGAWLNHYKRFNGEANSEFPCGEKRCGRIATLGAHVQIDGAADRAWYIVPLCDEHNRQTGRSIEIDELHTPPVSANVSTTCGKTQAKARSAFYGG